MPILATVALRDLWLQCELKFRTCLKDPHAPFRSVVTSFKALSHHTVDVCIVIRSVFSFRSPCRIMQISLTDISASCSRWSRRRTTNPLGTYIGSSGASHRQYHHALSVLFSQVLFLKQEFTGGLLRSKRSLTQLTAHSRLVRGDSFPLR